MTLLHQPPGWKKCPKVVYVAHPIAGDVDQNVRAIYEYCKTMYAEGVIPLAPYLFFLDESTPLAREKGMSANKQFFVRKMIDEVWLCGPRISSGMHQEIVWGLENNIPIRCYSLTLEPELRSIQEKLANEWIE